MADGVKYLYWKIKFYIIGRNADKKNELSELIILVSDIYLTVKGGKNVFQ